jgi:hypothetical protein
MLQAWAYMGKELKMKEFMTYSSASQILLSMQVCYFERTPNEKLKVYMGVPVVRFLVFMVIKIQVMVIWVITLCSDEVGYQRF